MCELSVDNAGLWLSAHGFQFEKLRLAELGGGISNKLVLAEGPEFRVVLKQSLGQLRTAREWNSDRRRIFREAAAMRWAEGVGGLRVPRLLAEDTADFTIAMEAAPAGAEMWKTQLFRGEFRTEIARAAGVALGSMISASMNAASGQSAEAERLFGDQTVFDELRIDPYYRYTAARCPEAARYIGRLMERSASRRVSLVHGDWSPKNLLVDGSKVWVIDWEVIHYGDPSFDVAFLLNHLLMKSIAMPQHRAALKELARTFVDALGTDWAVKAALEHLPALLLARVEGKSPAEYLDTAMQRRARAMALGLMQRGAESAEEVFDR
jgi:aminoglycoside phosphotransferase (APT) family kinase protein